ncbi:THAP domain-containing protein 6-like [Leuresthes tenuis]|uniref:THAP domain-containing protein 6-like n=1 Tax=Leuresthes tenuis TaxID=355514 RepID=UPI003B506ADE
MVGCAAFGCSSRSEKGVRMYGFPKDTERRKKWLAQVRRSNLTIPSAYNNRKLCVAHFEEGQFTTTKKGKVRLRADAVPTLFAHRPKPRRRKDPAVRSTPEPPPPVDPLTSDHTYCPPVKFASPSPASSSSSRTGKIQQPGHRSAHHDPSVPQKT